MRRVLHIFNALQPSGAETMWRAAAQLLARRDVETHVLATARDVGPYADAMRAAGFVVHHLPMTERGFATKLYRLVRQGGFDAVLVHTEERLFTKAFVCRLAGVRVVCVHHAIFMWRGKAWLKRCVVVAALRMLGCRFVAVSDSVADNERRFGHKPPVIWNWIDEARFASGNNGRDVKRRELGLAEEDKVLITVGNCSPVKNHAFLFGMMARLPSAYKLLHVGAEDEKVYAERRLAAGLAGRVKFLEARTDVAELYGAADVFVMSSLHEGLGLACIEALYCGLPAVVSDVPGMRDIARHVPACHVCALDETLFADRVVEAVGAKRPSEAACRDQVRSFVSMERSVDEYLRLLGV